ncbi:hypothetical protein BREVUG8_100559 [Brevundimonas sp. G8]|nr:hypothetical protein BREVUG8_100559 [Brevundimonas sp. G8]
MVPHQPQRPSACESVMAGGCQSVLVRGRAGFETRQWKKDRLNSLNCLSSGGEVNCTAPAKRVQSARQCNLAGRSWTAKKQSNESKFSSPPALNPRIVRAVGGGVGRLTLVVGKALKSGRMSSENRMETVSFP